MNPYSDKYEKESDSVASKALNGLSNLISNPLSKLNADMRGTQELLQSAINKKNQLGL